MFPPGFVYCFFFLCILFALFPHSFPGKPRPGFFDSEETVGDECDKCEENNKETNEQMSKPKNMNAWLNLLTFIVVGWIILKIVGKGKCFSIQQSVEYNVSISSLMNSIFPKESRLLSCVYHTIVRR